jgi:hypothetical protein
MAMDKFLSELPVVGGLFDDSDAKMQAELQAYKQFMLQGRPEDLDYGSDISAVGYIPESADYSTISEDPATRRAQLEALQSMKGLSESGLSDADRAVFAEAQNQSNRQAQSNRAAQMQNAQARGVSGSGLEMQMSALGDQEAANRAAQANMAQAGQASQNKANYLQAYLQGTGQQRDQDYRTQANNADIVNKFNMYNTGAANDARAYGAQSQNQMAQFNKQGQQAAQHGTQANYLDWLGQMGNAYSGTTKGYASESAARSGNRSANTQLAANIGMAAAGVPPVAAVKKKPGEE